MSLENPSWAEIFVDWFRADRTHRIYVWLVVGIIAIGGTLFALDRVSGYKRDRDIKNARIAVNSAAQDLKDAQSKAIPDQIDVVVKTEKMKEAVNAAVLAVNSTDAQKVEVNRASQNLANAVAANRPVDVTAADIEKRLDELGVK